MVWLFLGIIIVFIVSWVWLGFYKDKNSPAYDRAVSELAVVELVILILIIFLVLRELFEKT